MKNDKYRFRCIPNPSVIFVPEFMYDVEAMRKHPEYEEIDANDAVILPFNGLEGLNRIPMKTTPLPKAPVQKTKKSK